MSLPSIKNKLGEIFLKDFFEESDVVYILSRIRKILEIDGKEKTHKKLKFYCDWALHKQIDNTEPVGEELKNFPEDMLNSHNFLTYKIFDKELCRFLKEYNLKTSIYNNDDNKLKFHQKLTEIYADTPLIIKEVKKKKIIVKPCVIKGAKYMGVEFSVTNEKD